MHVLSAACRRDLPAPGASWHAILGWLDRYATQIGGYTGTAIATVPTSGLCRQTAYRVEKRFPSLRALARVVRGIKRRGAGEPARTASPAGHRR